MELTPRTPRDEQNLLKRGQKWRYHGVENYSSLFGWVGDRKQDFRAMDFSRNSFQVQGCRTQNPSITGNQTLSTVIYSICGQKRTIVNNGYKSNYLINYKQQLIESQRKMARINPVCIQSSFFDLGELDDPTFYKNQSFSLKYIHSICQLPSLGEFNQMAARHNLEFEQRFVNPQEEEKHTQRLEIDDYIIEAESQSDKDQKSIGSTNIQICSGSHISIAEHLNGQTATPVVKKGAGCNCKKTGCLKMYCQCFSSGKVCTDQCNCCNCSNCDEESDSVKKAKQVARNKHRFAFTPVDGTNRKHCNCRKTQCQKKYCECYNSGLSCTELCKCEDCLNGTHSPHQHDHEEANQALAF